MKKFILAITLLFALLLCSCDKTVYHWELQQDESKIAEIYIVDANGPRKYAVIKEISLDKKKELVSEICSLKYQKYGFNLHNTSGLCFVIIFENQEYDIISYKEPMHVLIENGEKSALISWLECDYDEFSALIEKYLQD